MDDGGASGIFGGAKGRKHRRRAGADILPHDDRHGCAVGDLSRVGKGL